jgi:hypothetical protein
MKAVRAARTDAASLLTESFAQRPLHAAVSSPSICSSERPFVSGMRNAK